MGFIVTWAVVAAGVLLFVLVASRAGEQFCLSFRGGKLLLVRGRVPQGLMNDFADTLRRANVRRATLKAHRTSDGLRLTASGVSDWDLQRLRNQLGHHGWSKLAAARKPEHRSLGQWLGFAWLAWLLARPTDLQ
jgi:hypothetical protein